MWGGGGHGGSSQVHSGGRCPYLWDLCCLQAECQDGVKSLVSGNAPRSLAPPNWVPELPSVSARSRGSLVSALPSVVYMESASIASKLQLSMCCPQKPLAYLTSAKSVSQPGSSSLAPS